MVGFPAVAALLVFVFTIAGVIFLVLRPQSLRVGRFLLPLSYCWVPCVGMLFMLICQSVDGWDVLHGLKGDEHVQPYGILILFMSLAYIAASLDSTGVFAWAALHITRASGGRGHLLLFLYYGASAILTALASNDVSIVTLTPIIIYFSRVTKCDPMPYLIAEFLAANLWSMLLFVGNPTNIIVAQAYDMTFIGYTQWMALPTLAAACVTCIQLYLAVRHRLPLTLDLPSVLPSSVLKDRVGACLGLLNMAACLVLLALAPSLQWDLWIITLVCAILHAMYNIVAMVFLDPVTGRWVGPLTLLDRKIKQQKQKEQSAATIPAAHATPLPSQEPPATSILMRNSPGIEGGALGTAAQGAHQGSVNQPSPAVARDALNLQVEGAPSDSNWPESHDRMHPLQSCMSEDLGMVHEGERQVGCVKRRARTGEHASGEEGAGSLRHAFLQDSVPGAGDSPVPAIQGGPHVPVIQLIAQEPAIRTTSAISITPVPAGQVSSVGSAGHENQWGQLELGGGAHGGAGPEGQAPHLVEVELEPPARSFVRTFMSLPWEVVPFVLGMFVLVEGLQVQGWVDALARGLGTACGLGWLGGTLMLMGPLSVVLSNVINNQPMTILLTTVCLQPGFLEAINAAAGVVVVEGADGVTEVSKTVQRTALFAVVVGSNVGALFTLIGALAGIMWNNIMREMNVKITYLEFVRVMLPLGVSSTFVALLVLWAEFAISG